WRADKQKPPARADPAGLGALAGRKVQPGAAAGTRHRVDAGGRPGRRWRREGWQAPVATAGAFERRAQFNARGGCEAPGIIAECAASCPRTYNRTPPQVIVGL